MKPAKRPTFNAQLRAFPESEKWRFGDPGTRRRKLFLENHLWEFTPAVIGLPESLPVTRADNRIAGQILRSGTSLYPNHGEAEAVGSRDDFIHNDENLSEWTARNSALCPACQAQGPGEKPDYPTVRAW